MATTKRSTKETVVSDTETPTPEDPAVTEALAASEGAGTLAEQYDAIVQAGDDLAAEGTTEADPATQDDVVGDTEETDELAEFAVVVGSDVTVLEHNPEDYVAREREEWIAANPDATVIPPSLLPFEYRDGTRATPGIDA